MNNAISFEKLAKRRKLINELDKIIDGCVELNRLLDQNRAAVEQSLIGQKKAA